MILSRHDFEIGRILISLLFLITAVLLIIRRGDFNFLEGLIRSRGVRLARAAMIGTIIMQVCCGVMILIGWETWIAAIILLVWLIPATLLVHAPWKAPPEMVSNEIYHTLKNMAIGGALLMLVAAYRP